MGSRCAGDRVKATDGSGLRKRQAGFAAVPNATIFDAGLSARALGVLVKVIALPEDWDLRMEWLVRSFPEGRDAITTAVRELRRAGFYRVERRRRDDGTFTTGVSVSDVALPEWAAAHAAACAAQGTDRPKFDLSLRVLADGRLEDEPVAGPPQLEELPFATEGDGADAETAYGKPVSGPPVTGEPVTGLPDVQYQPGTQTITSRATSAVLSPEQRASAPRRPLPPPTAELDPAPPPAPSGPPAELGGSGHQAWQQARLVLACSLCDHDGRLPTGEPCAHPRRPPVLPPVDGRKAV